jgi:hypothetical protein
MCKSEQTGSHQKHAAYKNKITVKNCSISSAKKIPSTQPVLQKISTSGHSPSIHSTLLEKNSFQQEKNILSENHNQYSSQ